MRSLLKFILQHSNLLVLILLEAVAFMLIVSNNDYPHSRWLSTANKIVAWNYEVIDNINGYFHLRSTNELLVVENALLREQLREQQNQEEDSLESSYRYAHLMQHYIPAKVIQLTTNSGHNYLTINKGERDGIHVGSGVICAQGVVGIVRLVSEHFAIVIPTIHTDAGISCRMLKNGYTATVEWDGRNPQYASLIDVASHISVEVGDSVVTSGLTPIFPAGIPVGIVDESRLEPGDSYYTIRVRLVTDYRKLDYVHVIDNPMMDELNTLNHGLD